MQPPYLYFSTTFYWSVVIAEPKYINIYNMELKFLRSKLLATF
jgi:hypothetical protein